MRKRDAVLELFFQEPGGRWRFKEIVDRAHISRPQAAEWLRRFTAERLVRRVKPEGRMPYYTAANDSPTYQVRKRLFALSAMESRGFLTHLRSLPGAKAVVLFGSMSRWDWYAESDIDLFIYGSPEGLERMLYSRLLGREIEVFVCKDRQGLRKFPPELMSDILEGYVITGTRGIITAALEERGYARPGPGRMRRAEAVRATMPRHPSHGAGDARHSLH